MDKILVKSNKRLGNKLTYLYIEETVEAELGTTVDKLNTNNLRYIGEMENELLKIPNHCNLLDQLRRSFQTLLEMSESPTTTGASSCY